MSSNLDVKITADVTDMQVKFGIAKAEANGLASEFNKLARSAATGGIDSVGSARLQQLAGDLIRARQEAAGFAAELTKAGVSASGFGSQVREAAGGVGGSLEQMKSQVSGVLAFTGIGAAIEGFRMLGETVQGAAERAISLHSMSEALGVTTTQLQAMQIAAEEAGVGDDQLFRGTEKLVQILNEAREGSGEAVLKLQALGITNDEVADKGFGTAQMLAQLAQRLNDANSATPILIALQKELGARSALVAEAIKNLSSNTAQWNEEVEKSGGMSEDTINRLRSMGAWWASLGREIKNTTADLVASYSRFAEDFFGKSKQGTGDQGAAAAQQSDQVTAFQMKTEGALVASISRIKQADLDATRDEIEATRSGSAERLALVQKFYQQTLALYGNAEVDKVREANRQVIEATRERTEAIRAEEEKEYRGRLEIDRLELESIRQNLAASTQYLDDQEKQREQEQAIKKSDVSTDIAIARERLEAQKNELDAEVANTQAASDRKYATLRRLTQQEAQLDREELQSELQTLQQGTAEYERVYNQIRELDARLQTQLTQLDRQGATDRNKLSEQEVKQWQKAVGEIENAESTLVSDIFSRRKTLSQTLIQIGAQLVQQEITNDLKAMTTRIAYWGEEQAAKKALDQSGYLYHVATNLLNLHSDQTTAAAKVAASNAANTETLSAQATTSAAELAAAKTAAVSQILTDAAVAGAGAAASVAAIPYIGWAMAPGVGAETYASTAAYSSLASLDVGAWSVPHDMVAHIHQGESVVPKDFASGMRENGGFGGGGDTHNHYYDNDLHIHALDGASIERVINSQRGKDAITGMLKRHFGRGR
jgi:hypothetical protein